MATSRDGGPKLAPAELVRRLSDPGFTPSVRVLPQLLELLANEDEDVVKTAERAVLRIEAQYAARVAKDTVDRAKSAERPARGRLTRLAGRLAQDKRDPEGTALAFLVEAIADADPKTRRAAARALGNVERSPAIEAALAEAFDRAATDDDKRAFAVALGKVGGEAARTRLAGAAHGRASVIAERELARLSPGAIDPTRKHEKPLRIRFHTRSGLEDILKEELGGAFGTPRFAAPGIVEAVLDAPLARALSIRTASHVGLPLAPTAKGDDLARAIVDRLGSPEAMAIFRTFTTGRVIRFRLSFARGGHHRAVVWRVAELVRAGRTGLVNDPKESTWEVWIDDTGAELGIELLPRAVTDERFAYREALVAASSHPTIAAALARVAPKSAADVVWDPFAGAGAELVERAKIGPYAELIGTDLDPRAVAAARSNLARAGVERATVLEADACQHVPEGVSVIITNPPMGRRVQRGEHTGLLERFVAHAARVLVPGGALVWMVPEPKRMRPAAEAAGLELVRAFPVDMGGFSAELSVYEKSARRRKGRP